MPFAYYPMKEREVKLMRSRPEEAEVDSRPCCANNRIRWRASSERLSVPLVRGVRR